MHRNNKRPDRSRLNKFRLGKPRGDNEQSFSNPDNWSGFGKDQADKDKSERSGRTDKDKSSRERTFSGRPAKAGLRTDGKDKPYDKPSAGRPYRNREESYASGNPRREGGRPYAGEAKRATRREDGYGAGYDAERGGPDRSRQSRAGRSRPYQERPGAGPTSGRSRSFRPERDREYGADRTDFSQTTSSNDKPRGERSWRGQSSYREGKPEGGFPGRPRPFFREDDRKRPFFPDSKTQPMKAEYSDNGYSRQDKHEESPEQGFSAFKSNYAATAHYSENDHNGQGRDQKQSRGYDRGQVQEHAGGRFKERYDKAIGSREQKLDPSDSNKSKNFLENQENGAEQEESILLFGPRAVLDTLEADPEKVDSVFVLKGQRRPDNERILDLCRKSGVRFSLVDEKALDRLVQGKNSSEDGRFRRHGQRHQGVIARLFQAGFMEFDELLAQTMDAPLPLLVALDQVQDPGNVGTLARTIFALGGAGLVLPKHNGVFLGYAALKASAGALAQLPVARVSNLKTSLKEAADQGFTIYGAAHTENATSVFKANLRLPAILVLGSEEKGLRESVEAQCPELLSVPMLREMDSLNVAQSGAIIAAQFLAGKLAKAADAASAAKIES